MSQNNTGIDHKQIGNHIKEVREQNDYSQAKLAEETDLSVSCISHIENAKRKASLESIVRIVNAQLTHTDTKCVCNPARCPDVRLTYPCKDI